MIFSVHSCVNLKTGNSNTANRVVHQDVATWEKCAEKCHQSAECNNWSWVSKNHANAELHFDCYFFTGNDVSTIANDHVSGTKESWNCLQTTGQIDGVTWSDVMANRLLRDKEHTIAATYTFAAPTKKLHFQEEILGNGDEDNAELNGQKISSMRTAKEIWGAVGAVKVAAQVEATVLCQHVKNLNNGYLRKKSTWLDFHQAEAGPLRLASEDIGIADNSSLDYEDDLRRNHHK